MKYNITLKNKKEISTEMSVEEHQNLWKQLKDGEIRMIKIENSFYNVSEIASIEPSFQQELIPKEFRLPGIEETTVAGREKELKQIKAIARMESIFNMLKAKGLFKDFKDYEKWRDKDKVAEEEQETQKEEEHSEEFKSWKSNLKPEEKKEFNYAFGEE